MDSQVEEIKRKNDIVTVVGQYVTLKKAGRNHKGLCPFHAERTPSFMVNDELGTFKCFGCGVGGDSIKFLMEIEGLDFREALAKLADRVGIKLEYKRTEGDDDRKKLYEVMSLASEYFHYLLVEHEVGEVARKYLEGRKINDKLVKKFKIGFAIKSWDGLVNYLVKKKGYDEKLLVKAGLVVEKEKGGVYDKFRGRLMFPLQDSSGRVVGFSGRIIPELAEETDAKYMNSPETLIYKKGENLYGFFQAKQSIREKKQVVVVEGQLDLISSYGAGAGETVAVGGTALTPMQVEMMARLAGKIIFALDSDTAGETAIKRSVEIAEKRGLNIKVVPIVGGKDPDEIARDFPDKWREMVEGAVSVYEWVIGRALEKYKDSDDRVRNISEEVIPYLLKIENEMEKDRWMKKLSESLGVEKDSVKREMDRTRMGMRPTNVTKNKLVEKTEPAVMGLGMLVVWLVQASVDEVAKVKEWFDGEELEGALGKLLEYIFENKKTDGTGNLIEEMPAELKGAFEEVWMDEGIMAPGDKRDWQMLVGKILRDLLERKIKTLQRKMEEAEKRGEDGEAEELSREVVRVSKKINEVTAILA